jgi:ribosomal protein L11 methyltransferase
VNNKKAMSTYTELRIPFTNHTQKEILIAQLTELGVEGFEEDKNLLKAFIPAENFDEDAVEAIIRQQHLEYTKAIIDDRNWNAEWESNFQPVSIHHFCAVRAAFHEAIPGVQHDIIITPKMSFGTGHHATTHMMIEAMEQLDVKNKSVFDFGTGTGVLAILAEKCGAASVMAIDNDDWSIENAKENFNANNCRKVLIIKGNGISIDGYFDVILANINRNIILQNLSVIKQHLAPAGVLLLSGLLADDQPVIMAEAEKYHLKLNVRLERNGWICLQLIHL